MTAVALGDAGGDDYVEEDAGGGGEEGASAEGVEGVGVVGDASVDWARHCGGWRGDGVEGWGLRARLLHM